MSDTAVARSAPPSAIAMTTQDDFEEWRSHARNLVQAGVLPHDVVWNADAQMADLLASPGFVPMQAQFPKTVTVSRTFLDIARKVICHRNPQRFALLYRALWRQQSALRLFEDVADADVRRLHMMAREVRRDMHKMRAFVRFRLVEGESGDRYVAWFEPDHHIVRANARFFVDRFTRMSWSILTPDLSIHWDGDRLTEGPGATARDAPRGDPSEDLWKRYYASIFNPARLKIGSMLKEMPRRYWKNMPETAIISSLVAGARARETAMLDAGKNYAPGHIPESLDEIASAIDQCRRCPIGCNGTRAIAGEGHSDTRIMIVGEQPGDHEEKAGKPFIGPAGRLLDAHLEQAGIDRGALYVTNAVKHFKYEQRGKRRIHQRPTAGEIDICRFWLDNERRLLKPRFVVALGASAARGVLGRTPSIQRERGQFIPLPNGAQLWMTVHPSYLLRISGEVRDREERTFAQDWAKISGALTRKY